MRVPIEVVPGDSTRMTDRQEFVGELVMTSEDRIDGGGRQTADGSLNPDDTVHGEGEMWRASVCSDTGKGGIPATHGGIVVMVETRSAEGELDLAACRDVEREPLWIEKVTLLCSRGDSMCYQISVVPGHRGMERDDQEKGHEEILGLWNSDGGERSRRLRRGAT